MDMSLLTARERAMLALRERYRARGYAPFSMSRFEEYDLYAENREFLTSPRVITFTDLGGRLLALKPDVTLSIVKGAPAQPVGVRRQYYNESVFRVSERTGNFAEILQSGVECIGDLAPYHTVEVLSLAAEALACVSTEGVLTVSHLGVPDALLAEVTDASVRKHILRAIGAKNPHGVREACRAGELSVELTATLVALTSAYGDARTVRAALSLTGPAAEALDELCATVDTVSREAGVRMEIDLSLIGDMRYYNGLIFEGYVPRVPTAILRGGRYDPLLSRLGKSGGGIGFAVYLDPLERLCEGGTPSDADILLLTERDADPAVVLHRARELMREGGRVAVQTEVPDGFRAARVETISGKGCVV